MSKKVQNQPSQEEDLYKKYEAMGFTGEDLELMVNTSATCETIDMVPDDVDGFIKKLDSDLPDDVFGAAKTVIEMTEKDPEYAKQILAFASLIDNNMNKMPPSGVGKVSLDDIKKEQAAAAADEIINKK